MSATDDSLSESPTGTDAETDGRAGSSADTSTSVRSQPSYPSKIEGMGLTTASLLTLQNVAFPLSLGYSEREVAKAQGLTRAQLQAGMDALRDELLAD